MSRRIQGRGATRPAALGLLGLLALFLGTALVMVAVVRQVPDPPSPASATAVTSGGGHHGGAVGGDARDGDAHEGDAGDAVDSGALDRAGDTGTGRPSSDTENGDEAVGADHTGTTSGAHGIPDTAEVDDTPGGRSEAGASAGAEQGAAPADDATAVTPLPSSEPVTVRVPAIGVTSPLHALGLAADGTLEVPTGARVDEAAWYSGSPTPGETGPSVIEGHVTGPGGRPSVFFDLGSLAVGDRVEVDRADGSTAEFEVYRVESHPKDRFPTVDVYGPTAGPELRLITCGGEFDEATGHHVDNTVVFARAVAGR